MNEILIIALCFSGVFTFAFGLAWFLPLFATGMEERSKEIKEESIFKGLVDILLVLGDMIPIFLLFDMFKQAPEGYSAAKRKWREERTIRSCFCIFCLLGISTIVLANQIF